MPGADSFANINNITLLKIVEAKQNNMESGRGEVLSPRVEISPLTPANSLFLLNQLVRGD